MAEGDLPPLGSINDAHNRAKALVKGDFALRTGDAPEGSAQIVSAFNNYWYLTVNGLSLQLRYFLTNLFRAEQFEQNQLATGTGLNICDNINKAKFKIETEELLSVAQKINDVQFDVVFKLPANEVEDGETIKKRKRKNRKECFESLKSLAFERVRTLEEEVSNEVETRYEVHRTRLGEVNIERLLRAEAAGPNAPAESQPSTSGKTPQFKPLDSFLGSRKLPIWTTSDTLADPKDLEMVTDYLYSGGTWQNIEQPFMYMKKLMDRNTLTGYRKLLDKRLNEPRVKPSLALLVTTLQAFIQARVPRRSRLTQQFERVFKVGQMGKDGSCVDTFTDQLLLDMEVCQWGSMTLAEATCLLWLKDIDMSDKNQEELGKTINLEWDKAEAQNVVFTVEDCRALAHKHWERVRQNNLTM